MPKIANPIPALSEELQERFWSKVDRGAPDECWLWTGYRMPTGYGRFEVYKVCKLYAHRVSYALVCGNLRRDRVIDHLCRNPPCVNPAHLEPVTNQVNAMRGECGRTQQRLAAQRKANRQLLARDSEGIARTTPEES